jgi:hypothetical protein
VRTTSNIAQTTSGTKLEQHPTADQLATDAHGLSLATRGCSVTGEHGRSAAVSDMNSRPSAALTYAEAGATRGDLPDGYDHLRRGEVLGHGDELFLTASDSLGGCTAVPD